jgi:EmrB/QacA subfamily drug resistance transporter
MDATVTPIPVLETKRGRRTLALLLAIAFLDFVDASIVNVALPSIRADLGFSVQNLQWVLSGYLLTYGGLMLLGGRAADLFGRRRILAAGTVVFFASSLSAGVAPDDGFLVASRLVQGSGAAMMIPACLSILTTTFTQPADRHRALGAWGAVGGLASAVGVFLGGLISETLDWRWVFFVNLPVCLVVLRAMFRLLPPDGPRRAANLDVGGALLLTAGMLLLTYTIVKAPDVGWGETRTIAGLAGAGAILAVFAVYELRHRDPLFPFSILRIKGLAAADVTQVIAMAGFYSMFFFITLYMQDVLQFSQIGAGAAYLPATFGVAIAAGIATQLLGRTGTRPVIVTGALLGAGGIFWISKIPVDGAYVRDLLPPLVVMSLGLGAVFVGVLTAAQAGVPQDKAGLAAAMINASTFLGGALGVAIFSAIATSRTRELLADHATPAEALTSGFQRALLAAAIFLAAAAVIALRSPNTRGEQVQAATAEPVAPVPETA